MTFLFNYSVAIGSYMILAGFTAKLKVQGLSANNPFCYPEKSFPIEVPVI